MTVLPDRQFPQSGSGPDYMEKIAAEGGALYDACIFPLTNTGGTANDVEVSCAPALTAAPKLNQSYLWQPASAPTGPMTMKIDGYAALAVKTETGNAIAAGQLDPNRVYLLTVRSDGLRVFGTSGIVKVNKVETFTASGTWTKSVDAAGDGIALVQIVGGGAGGAGGNGSAGAGGGGMGTGWVMFRLGDLTSTVAVTVGAGGAVNSAGGTSSFGPLSAYGGGTGTNSANGGGGAGGSAWAAGGNGSASTGGTNLGDAGNGGNGGVSSTAGGNAILGGGGGAGGNSTGGGKNGGYSNWGGGGGAANGGAGGKSTYAGNGGADGVAGSIPGGGGGRNAAGARGFVKIITIG